MQTMILFFRDDDVAAILRYAGISCLISLAAVAALAAYDATYVFPGVM
ncbi:MAG: hypothetical protein KGI29_08510 [Pseudomonadota bacterium]|nr:hypothetical protein [Pseudomonadota bacterium]MDE3038409.1 hypothetical protein [Pseudomonadota bacterium]